MKGKRKRRISAVSGTATKGFEPYESFNPIPWPVIAVALALAVWGIYTLVTKSQYADTPPSAQVTQSEEGQAPAAHDKTGMTSGQKLFMTHCATCHQDNGSGISQAVPPLNGSRYVEAGAEVPVSIILKGIAGDIEVDGNHYRGRMPTFGDTLSDEQISAIVNYVRISWTKQAEDTITPDLVAEQRRRFAEHEGPWSGGAELERIFGVPSNLRKYIHADMATSPAVKLKEEAK